MGGVGGHTLKAKKAQRSVTAMTRGGQRAGDNSDGGNRDSTCPSEEAVIILLFQPLRASLADPGLPTFSRKARRLDSSI